MMGSFISRTLIMGFGYVYPAYECYKVVEKSQLEILQLLFWCHYWIMVALLTVFERLGDPLISWLPLYNESKLAFFIYLWHPKTKGAACMFGLFLRPFISKHEMEIDHYLFEVRLRTAEVAGLCWHRATSCGQTTLLELLHNVSSLPRRNQNGKEEMESDGILGQSEAEVSRNPDCRENETCEKQVALKLKRRKWRWFRRA